MFQGRFSSALGGYGFRGSLARVPGPCSRCFGLASLGLVGYGAESTEAACCKRKGFIGTWGSLGWGPGAKGQVGWAKGLGFKKEAAVRIWVLSIWDEGLGLRV